MKIELYLIPRDKEGILLKKFLERNNLYYKEITTPDINLLRKVLQGAPCNKTSLLKIRYTHSIHIIQDFNPLALKQLLEHIKKYNCHNEKDFKINL